MNNQFILPFILCRDRSRPVQNSAGILIRNVQNSARILKNIYENLWFSDKSRLVPTIMMMFFCILFSAQKNADLIVYNARIYTVNQNFDIAEAMAISKGKIVAIGGKEILKNYTATQKLMLNKSQFILVL